jgi:hypothetical protein
VSGDQSQRKTLKWRCPKKRRTLTKKTSTCLVEHIIFIYCQLKEEREVLGLLRHGSEARAISLSNAPWNSGNGKLRK